MMRALLLCVALALLVPPGADGVLWGMALFSAAAVAGALGIAANGFLASAIAFTLNAIVGTIVSTAISFALGALNKPKGPSPAFGLKTRLRQGGEVPRSFILGKGVTAGSLVWFNEWGEGSGGAPNAYLTRVIALSDLPVRGLNRVWVNGEEVTLSAIADANGPAAGIGLKVEEYDFPDGGGACYLWVKFYDGTQTTADSFLTDSASSTERPWEGTRVGNGVAYAIVTARANSKWRQPHQGIPDIRFELDGISLYDPSRDGSEAGTGAHRYDTPATWDDATDSHHLMAVQIYNLMRGITYGGEWFYGLQDVGAPQLPAATWAAAVEAARTAEFRAGGEITVDTEIGEALEMLMAAGQARIADYAGTSYSLFVGAPAATVATFTDDDMVATLPGSFTPFPGLADSVNGVIATYPEPDDGWNMRAAPPLYDADAQAADGGRRLPIRLELPAVSDKRQVQRLARAALKESLRARRHTIALPAPFYGLEPGDVVMWTSARWGYSTKRFRVDGVVRQASLDVICDLTETDPSDFDWNEATDYVPVIPVPVALNRPSAHATTITVAPYTVTVGGIGRRPGIEISWTTPDNTVALEWQVRLAETDELVAEGRAAINGPPASAGRTVVSGNLIPATVYDVRGRWVPGAPREVLWSSWLTVTTPDARVTAADIIADINDDIAQAKADGAQALLDADEANTRVMTLRDVSAQNMLWNSELTLGADRLDYWNLLGGPVPDYAWGLRPIWSGFSGAHENARPVFVQRVAGAADQAAFLLLGSVVNPGFAADDGFAVLEGKWIEFSANVGVQNITTNISLQFRNDANAVISDEQLNVTTAPVLGAPELTPRAWIKRQVPTGATKALPYFRVNSSADLAVDGWLIVYAPMLCNSTAAATEPRPYMQSANNAIRLQSDISAEISNRQAAIADESSARTIEINSAISAIKGGSTETLASIETQLFTQAEIEGLAEAHILQEINAAAGASFATVTAFGQATADLLGNAEATYVLKADAGGGSPAFLRLSDGATLGSAVNLGGSLFNILGDAINLDGSTTVAGTFRVNGSTHLDDLSVTSLKIAGSAVTSPKIAVGATAYMYAEASDTDIDMVHTGRTNIYFDTADVSGRIIGFVTLLVKNVSNTLNVGEIRLVIGNTVVASHTVNSSATSSAYVAWKEYPIPLRLIVAGDQIKIDGIKSSSGVDFTVDTFEFRAAILQRV